MKIMTIFISTLFLIVLVATTAKAHPPAGQPTQSLRKDLRSSINKQNWVEVIRAYQVLEYNSKTIRPKNVYFVGLAYHHENQPAMAASFFNNFLSTSKPSAENYQSASSQLELLKSQLPDYCLANSRVCTQVATFDFLRNKDKGDLNMAFLLYQLSCNNKNIQACFSLGFMYENGFAVEQNPTLAISFYTDTCDKKYAEACEQLGNMYKSGELVEADLEKAISYYRLDCQYKKAGGCEQLKALGVRYSHEARPISRFAPIYPTSAAKKGIQGSCKMTYDVSNKGKVHNIRPACSEKVFTRAARTSLRKWKYTPEVVDGIAVASTDLSAMLHFKLD